ncbi:MAG: PGPGW domain-containing protein [Pseudomonadota bacterium]
MIDAVRGWVTAALGLVGIDPGWLAWATPVSLLTLVVTVLLLPVLVARLPQDYFFREHRPPRPHTGHWLLRYALLVIKNLLGAVLLVAGLAMMLLPGPGVVTVLASFALLNLPGKYHLERWLVSRPQVRAAITLMRERAGQPPLRLP